MNLSISNSDRAAKRFFFSVILSALICVAVFLAASEWLLRTQVVPQDVFFQQYKIYQNTKEARIVAFGDSHLSQGLDLPPGMLNLGLSGEGFEQMAIKLEAYLKSHPQPDGIILQLEPHMFANYRFESAQRDYDAFFNGKPSLQPTLHIADPVLRVRLLQLWKAFLAQGHLKSFGVVTPQGAYLMDYTMSPPQFPQEFQEIKRRVKEHTPPDNFLERQTDERMRTLIEYIKSKNIPLCILTFPVTPIYRQEIANERSFSKARGVIEQIVKDAGLPYHVYTNEYDDYTLYRNLDHLNISGAKVFTKKVLKDCFNESF